MSAAQANKSAGCRVVDLDDAASALTPESVGAKAARLARARALRLPVLPGIVVPASEAEQALALGAAAAAVRGSGGARLAIMDAPLDPALVGDLRAAVERLGPALVVRSSSALELDAAWAGAFVSYVGVAPAELETALRGCWASAFSRDAVERCEALGTAPERQRLAVLVQPEARFGVAGVAAADQGGRVTVTAAHGSPVGVLSGWESGHRVSVRDDDAVEAAPELADVEPAVFVAVARLARRAREALGDDLIEWGWVPEQGVLLLQSRPSAAAPQAHAQPHAAPLEGFRAPAAVRVARLAAHYDGPLGAELVLPWAARAGEVPVPSAVAPLSAEDPRLALAEARATAAALTVAAWGSGAHEGMEAALRALGALRDGLRPESLDAFTAQRLPNLAQGLRLIGLLRGIGRHLVDAGALADVDAIWSLDAAQLERAIGDPRAVARRTEAPRSAWEPFLYVAVTANGSALEGVAASPGIGAGAVRFAARPEEQSRPSQRIVLVVPRPLPGYAPLLWNAAALISIGGGTGAHLIEVARSLAVPAVVGCPLDAPIDPSAPLLAAVDGDAGHASLLRA